MTHTPTVAPPGARSLEARRLRHPVGLFIGLLLIAAMGLIAPPARAADDLDPPDRVGRISEMNGQVWIYATDTNEWIAAARNRPVTTGDRLSTEGNGRAEIRIGSSVLRVAANTELEVTRLDDDHMGFRLLSGSLTARLRTREAVDQFALITSEGRFRAERSGNYRFDRIDENSHATAVSGQAIFESDGTALPIQQGQRVEFWRERGAPQYSITSPARDDFGNWVASLDAREERSVSTRYVSAEMTGVEDLDRYGSWEQNTEYGSVWIPRQVAPGWAPYRMGHWAWVRPWGWTWVDDAPWGFAPFHYGRWVYYRSAWCWTPGSYVARPVYAPALVAWMGGPSVSVSVSVGRGPNVGWFPLGPREVYVPGYRVSPRYVRNVNVTQVTNINVTNIINSPTQYMANTRYVNRGQPNAVTVVPSQVVERRQPVAPALARVNEREMRDLVRERPRADAPVTAPVRVAEGARPAVDPRVSRPGGAMNGAPGQSPAPGFTAQRPDSPRDRSERDRDEREPRERRGRDNPQVGAPVSPVVPGNSTPPVANQPQGQPEPRVSAQPRSPDLRGREGRSEPPEQQGQQGGFRSSTQPQQPPQQQPQQQPQPQSQPPQRQAQPAPDRAMAPRGDDERRRHHEMPGPPRQAVQSPQPQVQQPQAQPQVQPQMRAPAPVMRQPEPPRQMERERAQPQPQPQLQQQRGNEDRGGGGRGPERGERGERGQREQR